MAETFTGTEDRDVASGNFDEMYGRAGNDKLTSTWLFAKIYGGSGSDSLRYDGSGEASIYGNSGSDKIFGGDHNDRLYGGGGDDKVKGGNGNDLLAGGNGNDVLRGEGGADTFLFDRKLDPDHNVDTIADFSTNLFLGDLIALDEDLFKALAGQTSLAADQFHIGKRAGDAEDRIIYNARTGALFYDSNGSDKGQKVLFAKLDPHLDLDRGDFLVVS